jgi:hypothetical protein
MWPCSLDRCWKLEHHDTACLWQPHPREQVKYDCYLEFTTSGTTAERLNPNIGHSVSLPTVCKDYNSVQITELRKSESYLMWRSNLTEFIKL